MRHAGVGLPSAVGRERWAKEAMQVESQTKAGASRSAVLQRGFLPSPDLTTVG